MTQTAVENGTSTETQAGAGEQRANVPAPAQQQQNKATLQVGARGLTFRTLDELWRFALCVAKSGLAPKGIQTPEAIAVAIQFGFEIGLTPMAALQNIAVVNGRPSIYGDAALAVVQSSGLLAFHFEFAGNAAHRALLPALVHAIESGDMDRETEVRKKLTEIPVNKKADDYGCTVVVRRYGSGLTYSEFTIEDAKMANLWGKEGPWRQYPDRMLKFRARGFALRDKFSDVLKGMKTKEEEDDTLEAEYREVTTGPPVGRVNLHPDNGSRQAAQTPAQPEISDTPPWERSAEQKSEQPTNNAETPADSVPSDSQDKGPEQAPLTDVNTAQAGKRARPQKSLSF